MTITGENGIIKTSNNAREESEIKSKCEQLNYELDGFLEKQLLKHENISRVSSLEYFKNNLGYDKSYTDSEGNCYIVAKLNNGKEQTYQIQEKADGTQEVVVSAK